MIFIDLSVPEPIAEGIKQVRNDVIYLYDVFPPPARTSDAIWLERCGREGWMVVSRDNRIRHRPGERRAILDHGVGAFVLAHKAALKQWPYFKLVVSTLDEMEARFATTPRPFLFIVSAAGVFSLVDLKT